MEKILIILDDDAICNLYNQNLLRQYYSDHTILVYEDPEKTLDYFAQLNNSELESNEFIIFLDLNMPFLSGFEFLEELEFIQDLLDDPKAEINVKVYMLTVDNSVFTKEKLKVFPMIKDFILKPLMADKIPVLV